MNSDTEKNRDGELSRELNEVRDDILACFQVGKRHYLETIVNRYFQARSIPSCDRHKMSYWMKDKLAELEKESAVIHEDVDGRLEPYWMLATPEAVERVMAARAKVQAEQDEWEVERDVLISFRDFLQKRGIEVSRGFHSPTGGRQRITLNADQVTKLWKLLEGEGGDA